MRAKITVLIFWGVCIIVAYSILQNTTEPLSDEFGGSYSCNDTIYTIFMAIDSEDENSFYYSDSENDYYIKGTFEEISENIYFISCDSAFNKMIIPDQNIIYSERSFMVIVNSQHLIFKKVHNTPILYGDNDIYK